MCPDHCGILKHLRDPLAPGGSGGRAFDVTLPSDPEGQYTLDVGAVRVRLRVGALAGPLLALALRCGSRTELAPYEPSPGPDAAPQPFVDPCWHPDYDYDECKARDIALRGEYRCEYIRNPYGTWYCAADLEQCPASCAPGFYCGAVNIPSPGDNLGYACTPCSLLPAEIECPADAGVAP